MKIFIVHAHREPQSFNSALTRHGSSVLREAGHEVRVSDLYAMAWNPVSGPHNFTTVADPAVYRQMAEEGFAAKNDGFAPDVREEMEKLVWCDALVLQFPIWWFGVPAILKGWIDRVFAYGFAYEYGELYETGRFRGKRALLSLTTGAPADLYSDGGLNGPVDDLLLPVTRGTLQFTGFEVLPLFVAYAVGRVDDEQRASLLDAYARRLEGLTAAAPASAGDAPETMPVVPKIGP